MHACHRSEFQFRIAATITANTRMIGASTRLERLARQEVPPKSRPTPCAASIVLIHLYIGDTIHLCLGVPCQPRQWTRNRHAPRQVRDDSMSCLNDGGIRDHNRVDARRRPGLGRHLLPSKALMSIRGTDHSPVRCYNCCSPELELASMTSSNTYDGWDG